MESVRGAIVERVHLVNFRNLADEHVSLGPGVHFVSGPNGAGKTNLLDAIYYLCLTRSHFPYGDASAIRHEAKFLRLVGDFTLGAKRERIVLKVRPRKGKTMERNGVAYESLVEHVGLLPAVMISPSDIELVVGGPEERRRFLDQTICQYDARYLKALISYNRILKLRNALLKSVSHPLELDLTLLATYDRQLAEPAQQVYAARRLYVVELEPVFRELYAAIAGDDEQPGLRYVSRLSERPFAELLLGSRDQDAVLRRTNVGVHRDELALLLNGENLRKFASQGQLKSVVLALRLAQARLLFQHQQVQPILLLDDLFDRLDPTRVQRLVALVQRENYAQVLITDTHADRLRSIDVGDVSARYYEVDAGQISLVSRSSTDSTQDSNENVASSPSGDAADE